MSDDYLIDHSGIVYEQSFTGEWRPKQGEFGPAEDKDWLGNPNAERTIWGDPKEARGSYGQTIKSSSGATLYHSRSTSGGETLGAVAGILVIGLFILATFAIAMVFKWIYELFVALWRAWRGLVATYPRAMLSTHLLLGMVVVYGGLGVAGFPVTVGVAGALGVPLTWGWIWLTLRLPLVLMPLNATAVGVLLWWLTSNSRDAWAPVWTDLTAGIPLLGQLPLIVAALPLGIWLWTLGTRRRPDHFTIPNLILAGSALWFLLLRIWPNWMPHWESAFAPLPLLGASAGLVVFAAPLTVWAWRRGMERWPLPSLALNVLLLGGALALSARHTQSWWDPAWAHWTGGLPGSGYPILVLGLSPITAWSWSRAARLRPDLFVVPNLIVLGTFLCLLATRTRDVWSPVWLGARGDIALTPDPALIALILPLACWAWLQGRDRWPAYWDIARAALLGVAAWWVVERSRDLWNSWWIEHGAPGVLDPAILALIAPGATYGWLYLREWKPEWMFVADWAGATLILAWLAFRALPQAGMILIGAIALTPLAVWGWSLFVRRRPRLGLSLTATPLVVLGALWLVAPGFAYSAIEIADRWLALQGVPRP